jgi:transposase InsO family protein
VLTAARLLGLACGVRLTRVATRDESAALIGELRLALARAQQEIALLTERLERLAPKHRPHYTQAERFRILELMQLHGWTAEETARRFLVTSTTIARWQQEVAAQRDPETVGTLVRPQPPVRHPIATVSDPLPARHPNHRWLMDLTDIPGLFRLVTFKLAVIFNGYARMPLAARVFWHEPSAAQLVQLFTQAVVTQGPPRHVVTDRGPQFTAVRCRRALRLRGIRQRFGAVGRVGSIAVLERFWRTLKDLSRVRARPPLTRRQLERRLGFALWWYAAHRPHTALDGARPAEAYGLVPTTTHAPRAPPRGRPGEDPRDAPWAIAFLDPDPSLPILLDRAA